MLNIVSIVNEKIIIILYSSTLYYHNSTKYTFRTLPNLKPFIIFTIFRIWDYLKSGGNFENQNPSINLIKVLGLFPSFFMSGQLGVNLCNFLVKLKSKYLCQAKIYLKTGLVSTVVLCPIFRICWPFLVTFLLNLFLLQAHCGSPRWNLKSLSRGLNPPKPGLN